ncbi:MAG: cyclic nucleotide-binding domain-containing protein [Spirochaetaceae bacterium]|jgi:CRP-like cAMP-binding protein|nr:cyclic nucleotide-binding domain-containing protein [Spirochaetaceae bacterium]
MSNHLQLSFVNFKKGAYIMMEGREDTDRFFIIRQGKVRIFKKVEVVAEGRGNILGPGDFFGVITAMSSHNHIETAQALTDSVLISVRKDQYVALIQNNTPVAMKIILQFSQRMRYLDEVLTRLTLKNLAEDHPAHLYDVGEYYAARNQYNQAYYAYHQYIMYCPQGEKVQTARGQMMKMAPYVNGLQFSFGPEESTRSYGRDTMIFSEAEPGDELYIIRKGAVKIVKIVDNQEVLLAVLKEGDIFGEMALLESKLRSASAVAYEDCELLAINRINFERMVGTQPQIIARLTTLLSERIWFIYKQLANTLIKNPLGRMYDALLIQLEKNRVSMKNFGRYTFDFGPQELLNMVGLSGTEGNAVLWKLLENRRINVLEDKLQVEDISEIQRQTEYYRKLQGFEKARHAADRRA